MIKLDPRNWHNSAMDGVHENYSSGKLAYVKANLKATLSGTTAFATQLFVLIVKNTVFGVMKGTLRTVCLKSNSPNWSAWKDSASKTVAYAGGIFLSAVGASSNAAYQYRKGVYQNEAIAKVLEDVVTDFDTLSLETAMEAMSQLLTNQINAEALIANPRATLREIDEHIASMTTEKVEITYKNLDRKITLLNVLYDETKDYLPKSQSLRLAGIRNLFNEFLNSYADGVVKNVVVLHDLNTFKETRTKQLATARAFTCATLALKLSPAKRANSVSVSN